MATDPQFASTPRIGAGIPVTAETSLTVPLQTQTILTAGASGSKIEEIVVEAVTTSLTPTTVAGLVYVFTHDGTTYSLFDVIPVTAVTASSSTAPFRVSRTYVNLVLPTSYSLRASQSIAGNASLLKVIALGADF